MLTREKSLWEPCSLWQSPGSSTWDNPASMKSCNEARSMWWPVCRFLCTFNPVSPLNVCSSKTTKTKVHRSEQRMFNSHTGKTVCQAGLPIWRHPQSVKKLVLAPSFKAHSNFLQYNKQVNLLPNNTLESTQSYAMWSSADAKYKVGWM